MWSLSNDWHNCRHSHLGSVQGGHHPERITAVALNCGTGSSFLNALVKAAKSVCVIPLCLATSHKRATRSCSQTKPALVRRASHLFPPFSFGNLEPF
jgi:hypothetical protein